MNGWMVYFMIIFMKWKTGCREAVTLNTGPAARYRGMLTAHGGAHSARRWALFV